MTAEERERLIDIQDRLIDLYVQRREARDAEDWRRMRTVQTEIYEAEAERKELIYWDTADV